MSVVVQSDLTPEKELSLAPRFATPAGVKERKTRRGCLLAQLKKVQEVAYGKKNTLEGENRGFK